MAVKCFSPHGCGKGTDGLVAIWLSSLKLPLTLVCAPGSLSLSFARPLFPWSPHLPSLPPFFPYSLSSPLPLLTQVNIGAISV